MHVEDKERRQGPRSQYKLTKADEACFECVLDDCDEDDPRCKRKTRQMISKWYRSGA